MGQAQGRSKASSRWINASGICVALFILLSCSHLKLALLHHKTALRPLDYIFNQVLKGWPMITQASDKATTQLMENMAQLWLQQEVKDLETGHEQTKGKYSPYLFVDHLAFINHLFVIKDIVASKKFAVIGKDII